VVVDEADMRVESGTRPSGEEDGVDGRVLGLEEGDQGAVGELRGAQVAGENGHTGSRGHC
jgi:hypothetical protein